MPPKITKREGAELLARTIVEDVATELKSTLDTLTAEQFENAELMKRGHGVFTNAVSPELHDVWETVLETFLDEIADLLAE